MNIAAIALDLDTITAGLGLLTALWQSIRAKRYSDTASVLVEGIEEAARRETNPKHAVAIKATGAVASTINGLLRARGWLGSGK